MVSFHSKIPNHFDLPRRINRLGELAYNLWWTWHPEAERLFSRLDFDLWERLSHNPICLLRELERSILNVAAQDKSYLDRYDRIFREFDAYMEKKNTWSDSAHPELTNQPVAYFSMEFGLHETLPIYSGGLGVLAGDHLKESSDLGLPLAAVGIMYGQGYFTQRITEDGWQEAVNNPMNFDELAVLPVMTEEGEPFTVEVEMPDRSIRVRVWEVRVGRVPLFLLDSNVEGNADADRILTARLYWSDLDKRIMQELLLGVGGVRALRALGYNPQIWHMNEGHAAFLILERARELVASGHSFQEAIDETRGRTSLPPILPSPPGMMSFRSGWWTSTWARSGLLSV